MAGDDVGVGYRRIELRPPSVRQLLLDAALCERGAANVLLATTRDGPGERTVAEALATAHVRRAELFDAMAAAAQPPTLASIQVGLSAAESLEEPLPSAEEVALIELIEARDERAARWHAGNEHEARTLSEWSPRTHARELIAALDAAREGRSGSADPFDLGVLEVLEEHGELSFAEIGQFVHWTERRLEACLNKLRALGAVREIAGGGRPGVVWQAVEGWRKVER